MAFEYLSYEIKHIITNIAPYFLESNGFGLSVKSLEDNIWDQCKFTVDILRRYALALTSPEDSKKKKSKNK